MSPKWGVTMQIHSGGERLHRESHSLWAGGGKNIAASGPLVEKWLVGPVMLYTPKGHDWVDSSFLSIPLSIWILLAPITLADILRPRLFPLFLAFPPEPFFLSDSAKEKSSRECHTHPHLQAPYASAWKTQIGALAFFNLAAFWVNVNNIIRAGQSCCILLHSFLCCWTFPSGFWNWNGEKSKESGLSERDQLLMK